MRVSVAQGHFKNASKLLQSRQLLGAGVLGTLKRWGVGTGLEFRILGPLEVRLGGTLVRVGGPRQRALLGLLLCHANRVLSRGQLTDELLSDQSPASADRMLRVQ